MGDDADTHTEILLSAVHIADVMYQYPIQEYRAKAVEAFRQELKARGMDLDVPVEVPPGGKGDFGFPCFTLAKPLRKAPPLIAKELAEAISDRGLEGMTCEAAGPYVNFTSDQTPLVRKTLEAIVRMKGTYGRLDRSGRVTIEHTSANPNGPFHVGRARNPIIGDTVARLMRFAGYDVETQYWVNDMGKQVAILTWGIKTMSADGVAAPMYDKIDHKLVGYYQAANKIMESDKGVQDQLNLLMRAYETAIAEGDPQRPILRLGDTVILARDVRDCTAQVLEGMKLSLATMNVAFDRFVWESECVADHSVNNVIERLNKMPISQTTDDGARFIDMAEFGIEGRNTQFVYTRSDGTSLYTTRDVAYHQWKMSNCDMAINILGEDHKLEARQLSVVLERLGQRTPEVIFYAFVALPEGKMSTRRGNVVFLDQLIEEARELALNEVEQRRQELSPQERKSIADIIGVSSIRYNIIRVQSDKKIVFKWEDALNLEGDSAPFIQYTYARASNILKRATPSGLVSDAPLPDLTEPSEVALVRCMGELPDVVANAVDGRKAHLIAIYAHKLATAFNQFYRDCPVISEDANLMRCRLQLVEAFRTTMRNVLGILGIDALESM